MLFSPSRFEGKKGGGGGSLLSFTTCSFFQRTFFRGSFFSSSHHGEVRPGPYQRVQELQGSRQVREEEEWEEALPLSLDCRGSRRRRRAIATSTDSSLVGQAFLSLSRSLLFLPGRTDQSTTSLASDPESMEELSRKLSEQEQEEQGSAGRLRSAAAIAVVIVDLALLPVRLLRFFLALSMGALFAGLSGARKQGQRLTTDCFPEERERERDSTKEMENQHFSPLHRAASPKATVPQLRALRAPSALHANDHRREKLSGGATPPL